MQPAIKPTAPRVKYVYTFIYSKIIVFRFQIYENLTTKQIIFKKD